MRGREIERKRSRQREGGGGKRKKEKTVIEEKKMIKIRILQNLIGRQRLTEIQ